MHRPLEAHSVKTHLMKTSRRSFLKGAATTSAVAAVSGLPSLAQEKPTMAPGQVKLAIATYSYWHFKDPKVTVEEVIEKAGRLGVSGGDVLHRQMTSEDPAYIRKLKRLALVNGVCFAGLSIHQDFVDPDKAELKKNVEHTIKCIQMAHDLGIPCMRLNSGRWNTIASFDKLMEARGEEPVLPGYTEEDGFKW